MLELLGLPYEIPYDPAPFYSVMFSIAVLILIIAFNKKRKKEVVSIPILDDYRDIQQFDMLGQPQVDHLYIQDSDERIIFTPVSKEAQFRYKVYGIFAALISLLYLL